MRSSRLWWKFEGKDCNQSESYFWGWEKLTPKSWSYCCQPAYRGKNTSDLQRSAHCLLVSAFSLSLKNEQRSAFVAWDRPKSAQICVHRLWKGFTENPALQEFLNTNCRLRDQAMEESYRLWSITAMSTISNNSLKIRNISLKVEVQAEYKWVSG